MHGETAHAEGKVCSEVATRKRDKEGGGRLSAKTTPEHILSVDSDHNWSDFAVHEVRQACTGAGKPHRIRDVDWRPQGSNGTSFQSSGAHFLPSYMGNELY